ncbi:hypothetical protein [Desulfallas thermosapovorans]|uniref:Uncharacterized protein n=1 Tax=Desulfallas thermosapovorans DSM 6562 TaxID=1121431 RepID=A0A5S4ZYY2_9FIRM|nr:hypothetical protein [Desulfallas thermosapovorans]TYO97351.1 hypothetical protein LX24_00545 [Desulfallas thermosapovorans DSM 6562]
MICAKCQEEIPAGEEMQLHGQTLCEDCFIIAVQPPKTCDVAAVHSAVTHRKQLGQTGTEGLTELQKKIYEFVKEKGKVTRPEIARHFDLKDWELERNFTVLRHCELLKGTKVDNTIYITTMN